MKISYRIMQELDGVFCANNTLNMNVAKFRRETLGIRTNGALMCTKSDLTNCKCLNYYALNRIMKLVNDTLIVDMLVSTRGKKLVQCFV